MNEYKRHSRSGKAAASVFCNIVDRSCMCGISTGKGRSFFDSSVSRVCVKKGEKYEKVKFNDYCYCVFRDIILLLCSKQ